ncbi:MAG: hypothetical protein H6924_11560 [Alphaproteobacteria bacterium]|nr:hypothetical protein [Alphaproteobacteria bacterium]
MAQRYDVKPVIDASRGTVDGAYVIKVVGTALWRALFDLQLPADDRTSPVDLRSVFSLDGKTSARIWLYCLRAETLVAVPAGQNIAARQKVGDCAKAQRVLIDARRDQIARRPGEEQQHRMVGVVRKTVARIGGRQHLAGPGVVSGGDELTLPLGPLNNKAISGTVTELPTGI